MTGAALSLLRGLWSAVGLRGIAGAIAGWWLCSWWTVTPLQLDLAEAKRGLSALQASVAQTAADRGVSPQALTDEVAATFQRTWAQLDISNDQFIRTTAAPHKAGVADLIERIFARNPDDFYEKAYTGQYCVVRSVQERDGDR